MAENKTQKTAKKSKKKVEIVQTTIEEKMETIAPYFEKIENIEHRKVLSDTIQHILETFPTLQTRIAWNQPMITDHGTFIIGFWAGTKHFSVAPESTPRKQFFDEYSKKYTYGKKIFRIEWDGEVDYDLLDRLVAYTIEFKKDCTTFWEPTSGCETE